ncbi:hypothetical protein A2344_00460 [Candidatus Peregrinibacteria bacterium RIFOXYB12_FULL_41_12]|nr:MAG: hypothetical protein A2244_01215 [Candidatus Peregrinibacteria bacterium RIFOXYA2_FULL_41_18]OGJ48994.1 MAG: hypothetical protein A2344_00460 [Candidatus Peregrinibacteria bacterium RIFOXYB12_FULL_41_12]
MDNVFDIYDVDETQTSITGNMNFSDVMDGSWYIPYLQEAYEQGIVEGYPDGSFQPGSTVNKVEILKMVIEAFGLDGNLKDEITTTLYADVDETAWYATYVQLANEMGIYYDLLLSDNFNPGEYMTRGEIAELVYRFADQLYLYDDSGVTTNRVFQQQ